MSRHVFNTNTIFPYAFLIDKTEKNTERAKLKSPIFDGKYARSQILTIGNNKIKMQVNKNSSEKISAKTT